MSDLIKVAKQVKKGALEAINRLKFSHSDEELDLRSRLLSLYREANFTVDTLTATSNDATPRSQPSHIDSLILEKTLHDALSVLKNKSSDTNSLRLSWLGLTSANKDLCRQLWNTRWILPEAEAYQGPSLLIPFALKPFRVVVGDISDIQLQTPISHIFDSSITHHMRSIIQLLLQSNYTTEARLKGRRSLQDRLLLSLWCDTARALQLWEAELSRACLADHKEVEISSIEQIRATIDQFDQGLRDLLVRNRNDKLSIAVIGVEGSGKSSFLNYIIGRDLLLEEVGQATTYPCRIRHKPGQTTPELTIDATYLNERVVLIRARPLFQALKEAEWDPKFVASDPRFRLEVQQWLTIVQRVKGRESLTAIADPDFALNGPFVGDEAVATALQHANHIVSICRLLDIPFELFSDSRWATITVEFGEVGKSDKPYELLDLPGLYGRSNQMYWQDVVRETIRHAKVVVAMISALDVFAKNESAHVWRELPQMISSGTSVVPSAVILTQSDRLPVTERDNSAARFKEIREEFWPDATSTSVYQVYECSVLQGRSGKALLHAIESSDELPVATLWRTHAYYALAVTLDAETLKEAEELIQTVERGDLKSSAKRIQTRGNMDNTTNGLFGLCEMAANKNTALEAQGVGRRILQLLGGLRSLLHELNLFNYEQLEVLDAQSKLEQEQSSLLIEWAEKEGLLTRDYQRISRETRDALDERVEVSVLDAAEKSRQSNDVSAFDVTIDHNGVYFLSENAVDAFLASLRDRLMVLQEQTLASEEEYVHLAKKRHFSDLAKKAGQLDSTIEAPLLSLLSQNDLKTLLPEIKIPDSTKDELVTKQRITLRRSRGYKAAQERTLAWITRGQSHSIDKLSPLARSLLGLAAFFSYLLTFPISRHPEEATVYYVQLDRVVTALKTIISTSWDDSVSQVLQKRLQDEAERGKDLIGRAVQFAASQSTDFKDAPPAELSKSMQKIILTGYLNLIGAQASQEMIAVELST